MSHFQNAFNYYDSKLKSSETANTSESTANTSSYHYQAVGALYAHQNNIKLASEEFKNAVDVNPGNLAARNDLALTYARQNRLKEAENELNIAIVRSSFYLN